MGFYLNSSLLFNGGAKYISAQCDMYIFWLMISILFTFLFVLSVFTSLFTLPCLLLD